MARTIKVKLTRKWSDWDAGDIVELEAAKAGRVIGKGYGIAFTRAVGRAEAKAKAEVEEKAKADAEKAKGKGPTVETATHNPTGETATAAPQANGKPDAGKGGD
jgi:hypothetical protein